MQVKKLLQQLDLGNSVAEFDAALEKYFIETATFRALVGDKGDIIAGDKGTGKTALFRILEQRRGAIPELRGVDIIPGFNPAGNPVFQRLVHADALSEGQYTTVWKAYLLSLVGNWILEQYEEQFTDEMRALDRLLKQLGLRTPDTSASNVFTKLFNWMKRLLEPAAAEVEFSLTSEGMPSVKPRVEFEANGERQVEPEEVTLVPHEEALGLLHSILEAEGLSVWVVLDRLDEAFQGFPATEIPALRALLRTYLDLTAFPRLQLKIFVRKDLFRRIIADGFVNLTHINARKIEIVWDEEDLLDLLARRIRENGDFMVSIGAVGADNDQLFKTIFPEKVVSGEKRPLTWNWMMSRIRDGNGVKPPRNLIDLVTKSQEAQLRKEDREPREYEVGMPILEPESISRALTSLSSQRVEDTLLAEAGPVAKYIELFRDGKAEHNEGSLAELLGVSRDVARQIAKALVETGFLEITGESFKIPALYRDGLNVKQGKAF